MNSKEKGKIRNGFEIGVHTGSAVLGGAPLSIIFVVSIIFGLIAGLIGFGVMLITNLVEMFNKKRVK